MEVLSGRKKVGLVPQYGETTGDTYSWYTESGRGWLMSDTVHDTNRKMSGQVCGGRLDSSGVIREKCLYL